MASSKRSGKQSNQNLRKILKKVSKENLYSTWDTNINPRFFMWEIYKQPICHLSDERNYSQGALNHLLKYGMLIDEYSEIEDITNLDKESDDFPSLFESSGSQSKKFLYKDNLVTATMTDDYTYRMEFYRPLCKSFINKDFEKWVLQHKGESKVSVLVSRGGSLVANKISFQAPIIEDLELNYGTGFKKTYDKIVKKLNEKNGKVFIFSGEPGTGKSVLIKHLTSIVNREFIFVPVGLSNQINDPSFISLLLGKKEAVLVLEDAEKAIQQRGTGNGDESAVANLLNLSDGLLSSVMSISILLTFNAPKHTVDKAFLRKGRLAYDYHFGPLNKDDATRLAKHLKKDIKITESMTLADIYGIGDDTGINESSVEIENQRQMGFHTLISNSTTPKQEDEKEKEKKVEET